MASVGRKGRGRACKFGTEWFEELSGSAALVTLGEEGGRKGLMVQMREPIKKGVGCWRTGSRLVGLPMKGLLEGWSFTSSRTQLALGGTVSPEPARPQISKHQNQKTCSYRQL